MLIDMFAGFAVRRVSAFVAQGALGIAAQAQLVAERVYFGYGRQIPVRVQVPPDFEGDAEVRLHDPATLAPTARAAVAPGRVDLAGVLPVLWDAAEPGVALAQLYLDGVATGPPLVVQPLLSAVRARLVDPYSLEPSAGPDAELVFEDELGARRGARGREPGARARTFSGYRVYPDALVSFDTSLGEIVFRLRPDAAPNTAFHVRRLVADGFYTDIRVHRVVERRADNGERFVIQFGDPTFVEGFEGFTGDGDAGFYVDLERSTLEHDYAVLSVARDRDPDSNSGQLFICLSRAGTAHLDGRYTAFGEAVSGGGVIERLAVVPVDENDRPIVPPVVQSARLVEAPPVTERRPVLAPPSPRPIDR